MVWVIWCYIIVVELAEDPFDVCLVFLLILQASRKLISFSIYSGLTCSVHRSNFSYSLLLSQEFKYFYEEHFWLYFDFKGTNSFLEIGSLLEQES